MSDGSGWKVMGLVFIFVAGLVLTLTGGTCTYFLAGGVLGSSDPLVIALLLFSLALLAVGIVLIVKAIRELHQMRR